MIYIKIEKNAGKSQAEGDNTKQESLLKKYLHPTGTLLYRQGKQNYSIYTDQNSKQFCLKTFFSFSFLHSKENKKLYIFILVTSFLTD